MSIHNLNPDRLTSVADIKARWAGNRTTPNSQDANSQLLRGWEGGGELPQRRQVLLVVGIDRQRSCSLAAPGFFGLNQDCFASKSSIVEQAPKRLDADEALAYVLVPIDAAAARLLGVVAVKNLESIESHEPFERFERVVVARRVGDVVPGSEQVTGVKADTDAASRRDASGWPRGVQSDDRRSTLSRRVLEKHHHLLAYLKALGLPPR